MKKIALALALLSAMTANAADRRVIINNLTGMHLVALYGSNVSRTSWEEDILGRRTIPPYSSATINFNDGTGSCYFDLKAVFESGDFTTREDVNVCQVEQWTIVP